MPAAENPFKDEFKDIFRNAKTRMMRDLATYLDRFIEISGMSPTSIGEKMCGDRSYIHKLRSGARALTPEKYDQIIGFCDSELEANWEAFLARMEEETAKRAEWERAKSA